MPKKIGGISENLTGFLKAEPARLAEGVTAEVKGAGRGLQGDMREQTLAAGLGRKLAKAWDVRSYPRGRASLGAASLVVSKAVAIHEAFGADTVIVGRKRYLVIPTKEAIAMGLGRLDDNRDGRSQFATGAGKKWGRLGSALARCGDKNIVTVPTRRGNLLVLYRPDPWRGPRRKGRARGRASGRASPGDIPLFTLVRSVRLRKRLDLDRPAQRRLDQMYAGVARVFEANG